MDYSISVTYRLCTLTHLSTPLHLQYQLVLHMTFWVSDWVCETLGATSVAVILIFSHHAISHCSAQAHQTHGVVSVTAIVICIHSGHTNTQIWNHLDIHIAPWTGSTSNQSRVTLGAVTNWARSLIPDYATSLQYLTNKTQNYKNNSHCTDKIKKKKNFQPIVPVETLYPLADQIVRVGGLEIKVLGEGFGGFGIVDMDLHNS